MRKTEKGDNSVIDLQNFTKVNQVIYTLDTICDPNILTLAQALLEIFCSQASLGYDEKRKRKREIIESLIYIILPKVNQVIYTLDTIYDSNIMTLAQAVLEIFCSQASIGSYLEKRKREIIQSWI